MDRFFAPRSLAIYGLSRRPGNTARVIVDNCRRWGFRGPIVGINPQAAGDGGDDPDIRASAEPTPTGLNRHGTRTRRALSLSMRKARP